MIIPPSQRRRVAVVTGSRAEFGLLTPVMRAIQEEQRLELQVIVAGAHFLPPEQTFREVEALFAAAAAVPMQDTESRTLGGRAGRLADAAALSRGVHGFARAFERLDPDWVVVLGDRIEPMAAAAAAAVGGIATAHIHAGDRAEGVADESMRHAISKLAHAHFAATAGSAERLVRMGERPETVFLVGSPAIDELASIPPMNDDTFRSLGSPEIVLLLHPIGRPDAEEHDAARALLEAVAATGRRVLLLHPNRDPGRAGILEAIIDYSHSTAPTPRVAAGTSTIRPHLPRRHFVGLLKRARALVGNSSAGLIEAAALGCPAVDIGPRQAGRERPPTVLHVSDESPGAIAEALHQVLAQGRVPGEMTLAHPYGDGHTGPRIAEILAAGDLDPRSPGLLRKRNTY